MKNNIILQIQKDYIIYKMIRSKRDMISLIQDGCFSHHVSNLPIHQYIPFKNIWIRPQTKAHILLKSYYEYVEPNTEHIVVYRGLRLPHLNTNILHHPFPFSTSLSLQFVKEWVSVSYIPTNINVILCIYLPKYRPILPFEEWDLEQEINLPPGQLVLTRRLSDENNITLYSCKYIPYEPNEVIDFFKQTSIVY